MPQFPERCKDLIRGMLTLDPAKRFTISQIKAHECFRGEILPDYIFPTPLPTSSYSDPVPIEQLSEDIIDTLIKIGYPDKDSLIAELTAHGPSVAKIFFHMITKLFALDQIDWSQSLSAITTSYEPDDSDLVEEPQRQAFAVMGTDKFHRHVIPLSHRDEPMSLAHKAEWALPVKEQVEYEQVHMLDCSSIPLTYSMLSVQRAVRQLGMQWFHPDDFSILCRHEEMGLYCSAVAAVEGVSTSLSLQLYSGTPEAFTVFCKAVESSFMEVREYIIEMEEDSDDDDYMNEEDN